MSLQDHKKTYFEEINPGEEYKKIWNEKLNNDTSLLNQIKLVKKIIEELHDNISESSDGTAKSKSGTLKRPKIPLPKQSDIIKESKKLLERADELKDEFLHLCKSVDATTHTCPKKIKKTINHVKRKRLTIPPPPPEIKTAPPEERFIQTDLEDFNDNELNLLVDRILDTNPRKIVEKIFHNPVLSSILNHECPLKKEQKNKTPKKCRNPPEHELKSSTLNADTSEIYKNVEQSEHWSSSSNSKSGQYTVYSQGPAQSSSKSSNDSYVTYHSKCEKTEKFQRPKSNPHLNDFNIPIKIPSTKSNYWSYKMKYDTVDPCGKSEIFETSFNDKQYKIKCKTSELCSSSKNRCHEIMSNDSKTKEITSNADNKQNVVPIENFVAVTKNNNVIVNNNANLNNNNNALSWHIPRPSLISSQENSVYTSVGSSVVTDYHHHPHPPTKGGQRGGYQNFRTGRGSTSTQGSSSSNNSTQSAKSGSLLLTVANLAKIDQEQLKIAKTHDNKINHHDQHAINLQYYLEQQNQKIHNIPVNGSDVITSSTTINPLNTTTINNNKSTKDIDTLSIASSTHFTVVNGLDRYRNKISQNNSCCRKHKLTVLTLTMSSIFMFGIIVAVYLFEMRAMHLRNS